MDRWTIIFIVVIVSIMVMVTITFVDKAEPDQTKETIKKAKTIHAVHASQKKVPGPKVLETVNKNPGATWQEVVKAKIK